MLRRAVAHRWGLAHHARGTGTLLVLLPLTWGAKESSELVLSIRNNPQSAIRNPQFLPARQLLAIP
jgi:hypothetical protein